MTKKKLLNYISAGLFLFVLIGLFIPYMSYYSSNQSFWESGDSSGWLRFFTILMLIFSLIGVIVNAIGKFQEFSFFASGFIISINVYYIALMDSMNGPSFAVGFYFMLIGSILVLALNTINMFIKDGPLTSNKPVNQYGQYPNGQYPNGQYQNPQPMNNQYGQYQNPQPMNNQYGQYQNPQPMNNQFNNNNNFHN